MIDLANAPDFAVQLDNAQDLSPQFISDAIQSRLAIIIGATPTMQRTTDALIASTNVVTIGAWFDLTSKPSPAETTARDAWIATVTTAKSILLESQGGANFSYFVTLSGLNSIISNQLETAGTTYSVAPEIDVILASAVVTLNPAKHQLTTTIQGRVTALSVHDIGVTVSRTDTLGTKTAPDGTTLLAVTSSTSGHANLSDVAKATAEGIGNPVAGTAAVVVGALVDARVLPHDIQGAGDVLTAALRPVILTPPFGDGYGKITFIFLQPVVDPGYLLFGTLALPGPRALYAGVVGPTQVTIGAGATVTPVYLVQATPDLEPGFPIVWEGNGPHAVFQVLDSGQTVLVDFSSPPGAVNGATAHHIITVVCGPDSDGFSVTSPPLTVTTVVDTLKPPPPPVSPTPHPITQK